MSGNVHSPNDLKQMQSLPLEAKERMSMQRLEVWYRSWCRAEIENLDTGKIRQVTYDAGIPFRKPPMKENEVINSIIDGQVYVSFSGGKDSTVLADLAARVCQANGWTLYLLFVNTGLEYPEIQKFVKTYAEWLRNTYEIEVVLDIVRPEMRFDEVIKRYGYPVISKTVSNTIAGARNSINKGEYSLRLRLLGVTEDEYGGLINNGKYDYEKAAEGSKFEHTKYRHLLDADFNSSDMCCNVMKKAPAKEYAKRTGRKPIIGTMAHESMLRKKDWLKHGCNAFTKTNPSSQPISFWTNQDILHYLKQYNIPYCSVYGEIQVKPQEDALEGQIDLIDYLGEYEAEDTLITTGCDRTGCIFCMFGCHLEKEPNRFQRLKETHPRQYEYCIGGGEHIIEWYELTQDGRIVKIDSELQDGKGYIAKRKWQPNKEGLGLGYVLNYIGVKYD